MKYRITVYEDYAIIRGSLSSEILLLLIRFCKKEGFTHLKACDDGKGFKLVRENESGNK